MSALAKRLKVDPRATQRILVLDIERLPGFAPVFDQKQSFIPVYKWSRLPSLLCFAAKWYGQRQMLFHAAWDDPEAMVQASWDLYDQADIIVGYNQARFDNKHLKSAWLLAGLPPPSPFKNVDLYAANRQHFGFESKSLAHLCHVLGIQGKTGHYDPFEAEKCMDGDEAAQRRMKRYNIGDVRATEGCYDRLRPYIHNHPHVSTNGVEILTCNKCGSTDVTALPKPYRAVVMEYAAYRCDNCGGVFRAGHVRRIARTQGVQ